MIRCLALLFALAPAAQTSTSKPRLLVLTDIGGDPDDQQSMVRLMTYSNEFDIEGLVASSRMGHGADIKPELIHQIVDAYGQVRANLALHRPGYPDVATLRNAVKRGNPNFGTSAVGSGKDTEGSNWIISVVDRADSRPVNVSIWGGSTDLAQALWRVRNDRTSSQLAAFLAKIRVHAIGDQDNTGPWIRQQFPSLWYILDLYPSDKFQSPYRGMYLGGDTSIRNGTWVQTHVRTNHGPLGALYPATAPGSDGVKEGDTPSWFYFLPNGLQSPDKPGWGGWGGRFSGSGPQFASDALDTVGSETSRRATVWRWRPHFQNDFQARMDACVKPFSGANHPPVAVVAGGTSKSASPGQTVVLDASGSSDPDGHARTYKWWVYKEAGSHTGTVSLSNATSAIASFVAPSVSATRTVHVILEVRDNGTPALTSYRRVVVVVSPGTTANQPPAVSITQPAADGQTFAPGATLSFAGTASDPEGGTVAREWLIDRIGDGLAAAKLAATGTSGTQVLSGSIGSVQLGVDGTDYDLVFRATDPQGLAAEVKRRYRVQSGVSTPFSVTVKSVSTGRPYSVSTAKAGALYYVDRSYTVGSLSSALANQTLVRTANDDKNVTSSAHLTLTLSGAATVFVGYDKRATKAPSWLGGWTLTSESLAVSDSPASPLRVYSKAFAAGDVVLGGNQTGGPTGASSHYVVVVKGSSSTSTARALPDDVWEHPGDTDGDGLLDAFEAANGTDASTADSDGDGTPDEGELDASGRALWDVQEASSGPADDGGSGGGNCGLLGAELFLVAALLRRRALLLALLMLPALGLQAQTTGVPVWTRWETSLTSSKTYANPYADVTVSVTYTGPSGSFGSHAFWDGGNTFRMRASFPSTGTWNWKTTCSDTANGGLHNKSGSVSVVGYTGTNVLYKRGLLKPSGDRRHLVHADGTPFLWMGDTAWVAPLKATLSDWQTYVNDRAGKKFTVIQISPASAWGGTADRSGNTPFIGSGIVKWNPPYWQGFDQKVEVANQKGLVVMVVGLMEPTFRYPASADAVRFARNLAARLQGNHVVLSPSFDSPYKTLGDDVGNALDAATSRHPITQHPGTDITAIRTYYDKAYMDFCGVQSGHNGGNRETCANRAINWNLEMYNRSSHKPVINLEAFYDSNGTTAGMEAKYLGTAKDARQLGYLSWLSGSLGYTYGAYGLWNWQTDSARGYYWSKAIAYPSSTHMRYMSELFGSLQWWRLAPAHALVQNQPSAWLGKRVVAKSANGDLGVAYIPDGNAITLSMSAFSGTMQGRWFKPTAGTWTSLSGTFSNSGPRTFTPPSGGEDWLLVLSPATAANSPPTASITQPAADGQSFAPGATLSFAGTSGDPDGDAVSRTWLIDRIGDGLAAATLSTSAASGSQVLAGSLGSVQLDAPDTDYDLILRVTDARGLSTEVKRRYHVTSATTFSVSIQSVSTGRAYSLSTAQAGALYYIDRSYTISSLSSALANRILIRTANDDKNVSASSHLTFTVSGSAVVYVGYDKRATKAPTWLSGWTTTEESLAVTDASASPLRVYSKSFAAGTVTLGGNQTGGPTGALSHYVVVVKPSSSTALEVLAYARTIGEDVWEHPGDADGDGLQDAFEAGQGTDGSSADSDGDGTPDEAELDGLGRTLWDVQEAGAPAGDDGSSSGACGLLGVEALVLFAFALSAIHPFKPRRAKRIAPIGSARG